MSDFTIFPVPAIKIHEKAYIPTLFSTWMRANIRSLKLEEGNDYIVEDGISPYTGRPMLHYFLNLEPAIAIATRIPQGDSRDRALEVIAEYDTPENRGGRLFLQVLTGRHPIPW